MSASPISPTHPVNGSTVEDIAILRGPAGIDVPPEREGCDLLLATAAVNVEHGAVIVVERDRQAEQAAAVMTAVTVSVVIPTMNEAENVAAVLARLPPGLHEVIIVDGHSTDGTLERALEVRPDAVTLLQTGRGKGNALACGFWAATGDIVVMLDGDGSTDPAEIPRFVSALLTGADFAKGTRFVTGGGSTDITYVRRMGNRALSGMVNRLWGVNYSDLCYGYNAFWRRFLPQLSPDCNGFEVETLLNIRAARSGLRIHEVPSAEGDRQHGTSNLNARRDGVRVLRTIVAERIRPR
jgi:glycosyltransferase involved in cell wall biosynthesis